MKILWTDFAIENLKDIFDYYAENASKKIAHKVRKQILDTSLQLLNNSKSGQIEFHLQNLNQNHRYLLSGNYKIIYRIIDNLIIINDVFDTRREPIKMNDKNRNKK
ncbi:MAG TPA: type II toxin-antitoxin system RelE/ParE family toxin [Xanthomarina gelatinilytica]|uniref:Type II toxin-antitoxin system RelE/ParE family toxin n=1 Tax=Xanthomarina gelatinilytica TaxID=1137281 RepID=A0A3D6BNW6_9FLAO|nr:type II toxin-antitoxin system RelE/ParE family toxin [Xanthomarina gelatinilytica]